MWSEAVGSDRCSTSSCSRADLASPVHAKQPTKVARKRAWIRPNGVYCFLRFLPTSLPCTLRKVVLLVPLILHLWWIGCAALPFRNGLRPTFKH